MITLAPRWSGSSKASKLVIEDVAFACYWPDRLPGRAAAADAAARNPQSTPLLAAEQRLRPGPTRSRCGPPTALYPRRAARRGRRRDAGPLPRRLLLQPRAL